MPAGVITVHRIIHDFYILQLSAFHLKNVINALSSTTVFFFLCVSKSVHKFGPGLNISAGI